MSGRSGFWLLSTPYRSWAVGRDLTAPDGRDTGLVGAYRVALRNLSTLTAAGVSAVSPVVSYHSLYREALHYPAGPDVYALSRPLIDAAGGVIVLNTHAWSADEDVGRTVEAFRETGRPVEMMDQGAPPPLPALGGRVETEFVSAADGTVRKAHYGAGEQPWDVIVRLGMAAEFAAGNVLKYVRRAAAKNGADDLKKARWYFDRLLEMRGGTIGTNEVWAKNILHRLGRELSRSEKSLIGWEE